MADTYDTFEEPIVGEEPSLFIEPELEEQSNLKPETVDLVASQVALIDSYSDSDEDVSESYVNVEREINTNGLLSVKERIALKQNADYKSIYELEAKRAIESGNPSSDQITLAVQYSVQEAEKVQELAIEQAFADRMMQMLAADADNTPLVSAMLETADGTDSFSTLMTINERALRLSRIIQEKQEAQGNQHWLTNGYEMVASVVLLGADWFTMMGVKPDDVKANIPSELQGMFNKKYYEMDDAEYSEFISTFSKSLDTASSFRDGFSGPNEEIQLSVLNKLQNPYFESGIVQNTGLFLDVADAGLIALEGAKLLAKAGRKAGEKATGTAVTLSRKTKYKGQNVTLFGQRKLGSDIVVRTLDQPGRKGATFEASTDDALDQAMPSASRNPDYHGSADVSSTASIVIKSNSERFKKIIEMIAKDERLSTDEKVLAIQDTYANMRHEFGSSHAADVRIDRVEQGKGVTRVNMALGTEEGIGFKSEGDARAAISARKLPFDSEPFRSTDGSWFIKVSKDIDESVIALSAAEIDEVAESLVPWGKFIKSPTGMIPEALANAAGRGGTLKGAYTKQMEPLNKTIAKLTSKIKGKGLERIRKVTIEGNYESKWYTRTEFEGIYKRLNNEETPSQAEWEAYDAFILKNDIDHAFLNWAEYIGKKQQGYVAVRVTSENLNLSSVNGRKVESIQSTGRMSIYDQEKGEMIGGKSITVNELNAKLRDGYELYEFDNVYRLDDKTGHVNHILVRNGNIQTGNLSFYQVPYKAGGHRSPHANFILKQARTGKFANEQEYILNPLTHAGATTEGALAEYAARMNKALDAYQRHQLPIDNPKYIDLAKADKIIREQNVEKGYEGLKAQIDDGLVDAKHPFTVVAKDTNPPPIFGEGVDLNDVIDMSGVSSVTSMLEKQGKPYYRGRGTKPLRGPDGERAKLIDPMRVLEESMSASVHKGSMANFRFTAMTKWMNEFGTVFQNEQGLSKGQTFFSKSVLTEADFPQGFPDKLFISRAINSHMAITTMLRTGNSLTRYLDTAITKAGKLSEDRINEKTSEFVYDLKSKDPVGELRTWNYDLKLGFGALDQIFGQGMTAVTVSAMDGPIKGAKYMEWGTLFQTLNFATSDGALRRVANTMAKSGQTTVEEFEQFVRMGREAGVIDLRGDMGSLDHVGTKGADTILSVEGLREKGRGIVMGVERFNKAVAYAKAWDELRRTVDLKDMNKKENIDKLMGGADKWSLYMSQIAQGNLQKGILAVPGQFFPYTQRMVESMLPNKAGGNPRYTSREAFKMFATQAILFGSAGIAMPFYDASDVMIPILEGMGVDTSDPDAAALIYGGLVDWMLVNTVGATLSGRVGIGEGIDSFFERFMGNDFNETGAAELLIGPAGQAVWQVVGTILEPVAHMFSAFKALNGDVGMDLTESAVRDILLRNVNSASDVIKAFYIMKHGQYLSAKGKPVAEVNDSLAALAVMLGMTPVSVVETYRGFKEGLDHKENIKYLTEKVDSNIQDYNRAVRKHWADPTDETRKDLDNAWTTLSFLTKDLPQEVKDKVRKRVQNMGTLKDHVIKETISRWKKSTGED